MLVVMLIEHAKISLPNIFLNFKIMYDSCYALIFLRDYYSHLAFLSIFVLIHWKHVRG